MNVKYSDLVRKTQRIVRELREIEADIDSALKRPEHMHALKLATHRNRTRDAILHLVAATGDE